MMQDRIPTPGQEGRVLVTPEDGGTPYYARIQMADNPTQSGTALTKETLLQDETENILFDNIANRTVDDVFRGIGAKLKLISANLANINLTVQDAAGKPIPGVYVEGVFDDKGNAVKTDASGKIAGYVAEGSVTLRVKDYADIADFSETFTSAKGQTYTKTIKVTTRNFLKLTSSKSVRFSGNVSRVDVTAVGGGGGGRIRSGTGAGGGYCVVQENVPFSLNTLYPAIVGAGGVGEWSISGSPNVRAPSDGGKSSFLGVSANGGKRGNPARESGGEGNGNGGYAVWTSSYAGYPVHAVAGSVAGFSSFTETVAYGGGGGADIRYYHSGNFDYQQIAFANSAGYGGKGGYWTENFYTEANGIAGFGGGGGNCYISDGGARGGDGGSGCIAIRMHLASAA